MKLAKILCLAVAAVLSNWHSVLRAINLASGKLIITGRDSVISLLICGLATVAKSVGSEPQANNEASNTDIPLPLTLVRIPTQQSASNLQAEGHPGS